MDWDKIFTVLNRSKTKYSFYESKYDFSDPARKKSGRLIPINRLGWGKRAIEMRSNKTHFDTFENDVIGLNDILAKYGVIEAFDKLKSDVLIAGVGFLAIADGKAMPFTALEATGSYSAAEGNIKSGIAVYNRAYIDDKVFGQKASPKSFMIYGQNSTYVYDEGIETSYENITGRPLMTMLTYNATTKQPFGRSVLTRAARDAIISATITVREASIAAHHYNTKVDVILGADVTTPLEKVEAKTGDIIKIGTNEEGQIPQIAEFAQHAMVPFNDTILMSARNFCADTKLRLDNLCFTTNAPQSPEALEIVGDDLRDDIAAWEAEMGEQLKYFAVTLFMYENNLSRLDENLMKKIRNIKPVWRSVYRADISKFGDSINKLAQYAPDIVKSKTLWRNLGLSSREIEQIVKSVDESYQA